MHRRRPQSIRAEQFKEPVSRGCHNGLSGVEDEPQRRQIPTPTGVGNSVVDKSVGEVWRPSGSYSVPLDQVEPAQWILENSRRRYVDLATPTADVVNVEHHQ